MSAEYLSPHQPDILEVIANLSNDAVFTPPKVANDVLDLLPEEVWTDATLRWLDPCSKTGIFPREITKRLMVGLADAIPDEDARLEHILREMVFAIATEEITGMMTRRSLYCSKDASSEFSTVRFADPDGNVWRKRVKHDFDIDGRCKECKGTKDQLLQPGRDNKAYGFIHADGRKQIDKEMDMKFDVIVGNPPYQMDDGGGEGASAVPLYHTFVEQAKALNPKHIAMIIPARWYSGGKGLDEFRDSMLKDERMAELHDFPETELVFPGINIRGGVCYFLWSQDHAGPTRITNHRKTGPPLAATRPLLEPGLTMLVRYNEAISILHKVHSKKEETFDQRVQSRNPYGIPSNFEAFSTKKTDKASVLLYRSRRGTTEDREVYISPDQIQSNAAYKSKYKVLVSKASPGGDEYPHAVFSKPFVAGPGSVSTETYLIVDFPKNASEGASLVSYMNTRFFRFLVSLIKNTQNISKGSFAFVPVQDLSRAWTDKDLYEKYGITDVEQEFIESMVKEMAS